MKKSLLALAALTAFAGAASAQSSVTLFGIIDVNARVVDNANAGKIKSESTDGMSSSRLGFRGVEDLGGGMQAGFWLEGALGADTGCGGTSVGSTCPALTWQRRATVSLMGGFGEVRLGRDYTPTFLNYLSTDLFGYVGVATSANSRSTLGSGAGTSVRANNTISYFLPSMGGVFGQVTIAAGEGTAGNKYAGGRLGYSGGPVSVGVAYGKAYKTGTMLDDFKTVNIGGSYNFGFMKLVAGYEKSDYSSDEQKVATIGVLVPFGANTIKVQYTKDKGDGNVGSFVSQKYDDSLIGLGYGYSLSKRTTLYANYGRNANGHGAAFTSSGSGPTGMHAGETSTGYEFGINHTF